ncbi:hypothetical protein PoHVEF18_001468 [Penicillium ochrochloron]
MFEGDGKVEWPWWEIFDVVEEVVEYVVEEAVKDVVGDVVEDVIMEDVVAEGQQKVVSAAAVSVAGEETTL